MKKSISILAVLVIVCLVMGVGVAGAANTKADSIDWVQFEKNIRIASKEASDRADIVAGTEDFKRRLRKKMKENRILFERALL